MLGSSFVAMIFVILIVIIVFLGFQVNDNNTKCRKSKETDQEELKQIARLMVQSESQANPFWKYRQALEANIRLNRLNDTYGSKQATAKALKMDAKRLEELHANTEELVVDSEALMGELAESFSESFRSTWNREAGIHTSRRG